jgi:hypothetical protein
MHLLSNKAAQNNFNNLILIKIINNFADLLANIKKI